MKLPKLDLTGTQKAALFIFVVAFIVRALFIVESHKHVDFHNPTPGLDVRLHWEGSKHILAGTEDPVFELMLPSAPLHPYFVALCKTFLGDNFLLHRYFRAFLGSLAVMLMFLIGLRLTASKFAAFMSAALLITLPSWIYFGSMLIKASVDLILLTTALWLIVRSKAENWKLWQFILFGCLLGLIISILRFSQGGTVIYVAVFALYLIFRRGYATFGKRLLIIVPMLALMIGSQMCFKYREAWFGIEANKFLPVGGVHVRIGFQHGAIGTYHVLRRFPALPLGHTFYSRMAAEAKYGRIMTPKAADESYIQEVKDFIRENPKETREILLRKAGLFFNNLECAGNHFLYDIQKRTRMLDMPSTGFGGLVILAFWGIVAMARQKRYASLTLAGGFLLAVLISNLCAFITWRYRFHSTIALALLAGPGFLLMLTTLRDVLIPDEHGRRRAVIFATIMCLLTIPVAYVAFKPVLTNVQAAMYDTSKKNRKQSKRTLKFMKDRDRLAEKGPDKRTPEEEVQYVTLLHVLGQYTDAFHEMERLSVDKPMIIATTRQYIMYLMWEGNYDKATEYLVDMSKRHPRTFRWVIQSFESKSKFWADFDTNLRLIIQSIFRDILIPQIKAEGVPIQGKFLY